MDGALKTNPGPGLKTGAFRGLILSGALSPIFVSGFAAANVSNM
jgi:hypothetical protein